MDELNIDSSVKEYVLTQLMGEIKVEIFRTTCAYRAQQRVGAEKPHLEQLEKSLAKLEGLLASYKEQLEEVEKEKLDNQ
jgi:hypothetical protein